MPVQPQPAAAGRILSAPPSVQARALGAVRHGFFGREGGVSRGLYATLNAGVGSNDDPDAVAENRRRIAAAFGAGELVGAHQVHSADAVFATGPWSGERPRADALVTTKTGLVICVLTADCAPVLLLDAEAGVIGAAHAGWRGALGGVLEATVALMRNHGARAITAAIGPTIAQQSYEVGPEFEAQFVQADPDFARFFAPGPSGKAHFDLPAFCAAKLASMGIETETLPLDTFAEPARWHSARRAGRAGEPDYGRNCAAIAL